MGVHDTQLQVGPSRHPYKYLVEYIQQKHQQKQQRQQHQNLFWQFIQSMKNYLMNCQPTRSYLMNCQNLAIH